MGHRRSRGVFVILGQHHLHAIGGQHFQCTGCGRRGQRVSVGADEQRAVDAFFLAVQADGLGDRQHVVLVETQVERAAPVPRSAEGHALSRHGGVGAAGVIGGEQAGNIDQHAGRSRLACQRTERHAKTSSSTDVGVGTRSVLGVAMPCDGATRDYLTATCHHAGNICCTLDSAKRSSISTSTPRSWSPRMTRPAAWMTLRTPGYR